MLINKILVNQESLRSIKQQMDFHKNKANEAQKQKNTQEANEHMNKMLSLNKEYFNHSMKPMFASMLLFIFIFPWVSARFQNLVILLPLINIHLPGGWLGWYILVSIFSTFVFKKILGVQ